jgi:AcrR family transcriptional regulator
MRRDIGLRTSWEGRTICAAKTNKQELGTTKPEPGKKAEETRARILNAALAVFQERGFERATMREIATEAGVATGAAYYYFDSKDALVMAFYERAQAEMRVELEAKLARCKTLETRLRTIIAEKLEYFAPNRKLLGALSAHTDPEHPLSPFSADTRTIREEDLAFFAAAVADSGVKLPKDIQPYLPRLLWMYQMGLILFWVYDKSPGQRRTKALFDQTLKMLLLTLRIAQVPLLRPLHKMAAELLRVVYEDE